MTSISMQIDWGLPEGFLKKSSENVFIRGTFPLCLRGFSHHAAHSLLSSCSCVVVARRTTQLGSRPHFLSPDGLNTAIFSGCTLNRQFDSQWKQWAKSFYANQWEFYTDAPTARISHYTFTLTPYKNLW